MPRPTRAWIVPALLALLTIALTLWLWRWALLNRSWGNDEELYRHFAQGIARDWDLIFNLDPSYGRGIQRLHLVLLAGPMALWDNPTAFSVAHLIFVAIYASAAIPGWLIARGCGLGPYASFVPAALVVLTPWAVVSTSFLTESVGYGVFAWALWAVWRASVQPSLARDALALALLGIAVFTRTGFLLALPLLPVVAVLQAWRYPDARGAGEEPAGRTPLRDLPLVALRRQPLSVGLGLLGVLVVAAAWTGVLPGGPSRFTGTYSTDLPPLDLIIQKWRSFLSRISAGTGFLVFTAALAWVVTRAARPRDPAGHAFAWIAFLATGAVLMSLIGGAGDERYSMFIAFPVVVAACIAFLRRDLGPLAVLGAGVLTFVLFFTPGWKLVDASNFGYFSFPTESFMGRAVLVNLEKAVSIDGRITAAIGIALGIAVTAAIAGRERWRRWLPLVLIPAAAFQLAGNEYALRNHVNTVGNRFGPDLSQRAWVDQAVPAGEDTGIYAVSNGLTGVFRPIWREIQYWNVTMHSVVKIKSPITLFESVDVPYPFSTWDITADLDERTGRITWGGSVPFPRYMVVPQPPLAVTMDWQRVESSKYLPATLVRVARPLQARTTLAHTSPDGFTDPTRPAEVTVFRAARPQPRCVVADLVVPQANAPEPGLGLRFEVRSGERLLARGKVPAGELRRVHMPVEFGADPLARFTIRGFGTVESAAGERSIQVGNYEATAEPCP